MNDIESLILENIGAAVYSCDSELNLTYLNGRCAELAGISADNALERKCFEVFGAGHCSQMQPCPAKIAMRELRPASSSLVYYKTPAGNVKKVCRRALPILKGGAAAGAIVYLQEAEAEKSSPAIAFEERDYYQTFKNAPAMVHLTDMENTVLDVNEKWLVEMGYAREDVTGVPFEKFMCEESRRFAREVIFPQIWKIGNINGVNCRLITGGKAPIDVMMNCSVIETASGKCCVSVLHNITEQMNLTRELRETAARLDRMNIVKSQFVSNLGYEIRTPMTNIMGFTEMLTQTSLNPDQAKLAGHIRTSSESLLSIITSLLEYSRIDSGEVSLESNEFSFKQLIFEAVNLLMEKASQKSLKIYYTIDSNLKYNFCGDDAKLKIVLLNLLDNAIKFSSKGEIRICLSVESENAENSIIKVELSDQGKGLAPENLRNIFMPFYQVDNGITREHHGIGLGLTLAESYVKMMGGEGIFVESAAGGGSRFIFSVCLARAAAAKKSGAVVTVTAEKQSYRLGLKILVVEDNHLNIEVICRLLKICECGFQVVENGLQAIDTIKNGGRFDAILMDINLPEISGIETAKKLRELGCVIPIIAVTAYTSANDKLLCLSAGMNDYLTKPINFNMLVSALKTHCSVASGGNR